MTIYSAFLPGTGTKEFTDRFTGQGERTPTGRHRFDRVCTTHHIEHRLIPPARPQTNGMVERFNGRIEEILNTTYSPQPKNYRKRSSATATSTTSIFPKITLAI